MSTVVLNGIFVGCIYGLIGLGVVVVYRGSRVVNFAYGETGMLAAFVYAELRFGTGLIGASDRGMWVPLTVAVILAASVGALTELSVVRPLRNAPRIQPLIGTLAVGMLLLVFGLHRWGTDAHYVGPLLPGEGIQLLGLRVERVQLLIGLVAVMVLVGLWMLYRFTPFGLQLRATAIDPDAAGLVGVDVNRTSLITWGLAGALAGVSGILIAPLVAFDVLFMSMLFIRGLAAALVGGLTSISGAFAAGILIGVVEGVIAYTSPISGIADGLLAVVVLGLMVFRPTGLARAAY